MYIYRSMHTCECMDMCVRPILSMYVYVCVCAL